MPEALSHNPPEVAGDDEVSATEAGVSPLTLAWRSFRRHKPGMFGLSVLILLYTIAIFAGFIAPYDYESEVRDLQWASPASIHFRDANGFSWRPFIHPFQVYTDEDFNLKIRTDTSQRCYVRFFTAGEPHRLLGLVTINTRLFGVDPPPAAAPTGEPYFARIYLMGADMAGRDIFSRICYGARISMSIGLIGASIVLVIGMAVGGASGYFGGLIDDGLQRLCEMVMLLPGFYLLLMLRFTFPANMPSVKVYFAVVLILALVGWAGLARVIRGMVVAIRREDYVSAARAIGLTHAGVIARHVLPNTLGYVVVALTLAIPGYIIGESGLSVLGLGIMEPVPSWGNMLQKAMDIPELNQHPWVLWPGVFIFLAVMAFNLVGDGLRDAIDPRSYRR